MKNRSKSILLFIFVVLVYTSCSDPYEPEIITYHDVETDPGFTTSDFTNYSSAQKKAVYSLDINGNIHIEGFIDDIPNSAITEGYIFTLLAGFRPSVIHYYSIMLNNDSTESGNIKITPNGHVIINTEVSAFYFLIGHKVVKK